MIGAFVALRPPSPIFAAVLVYRVFAFWLPIPPGVVAFLQLRKTVRAGRRRGAAPSARTSGRRGGRAETRGPITSESKV